ncbi:MAG: response regulator [Planctomycetota bacterium]|jgi:DNA-binding NtrC family response regulator
MGSRKPAKILIIDDDASMVRMLAARLGDDGYDCVTATSRKQGLSRFRQGRFDLVITDMIMPKPDGFSLVDMIREVGEVPVIVVSGYARNRPPFLSEFCDVAFVSKPFDWRRLSDLVQAKLPPRLRQRACALERNTHGEAPGPGRG